MTEQPKTHDAYALRKEGRLRSRWLEIGHGSSEKAHCPKCRHEFAFTGIHRAMLDRLPTGGFSGQVTFSPIGVKLQEPEPQPARPDEADL